MYDIHTHLYLSQYDADRDAVIARARAAGIDGMFAIGCTVEESRQCVALAEEHPEIFASVGIHPHAFNDRQPTTDDIQQEIQELKKVAQGSKKVVAIGECGIDYYAHERKRTVSAEHKALQKEGFIAQIALANELSLPLIVHCRSSSPVSDDAYRDLFDILKATSHEPQAIILHCYMGDTEVTKTFLELPNVYFSFAGNITYPVKKAVVGTKDDLTETVKLIPLELLFVETDCPFLAPQTKRGERNEPAYVTLVAEAVAKLHGADQTVVEMQTRENVRRVFGKMVDQVY
ncbi:MAG: TatD family hydrolase [Candidatus Moraniibacteriota bacterium]